jgi:hypothetical protein
VKKDRTTARKQSSSKRRTTESQDAKSRKCRECSGPSAPCGTKRIAELAARICLCRMLNVTLNNTHPALQDREQWHQHFFGTATLRRTVCVSRMTYFFWRKNSTAQLRDLHASYARRVDPSVLAFSLSSHGHTYVSLLVSFRFVA